jgi:hypothetical protein
MPFDHSLSLLTQFFQVWEVTKYPFPLMSRMSHQVQIGMSAIEATAHEWLLAVDTAFTFFQVRAIAIWFVLQHDVAMIIACDPIAHRIINTGHQNNHLPPSAAFCA